MVSLTTLATLSSHPLAFYLSLAGEVGIGLAVVSVAQVVGVTPNDMCPCNGAAVYPVTCATPQVRSPLRRD
jgi:hypothetical protein